MSWIWKTDMMGWVEQKLINLTTTIYMKRREPDTIIAPLGAEVPPTKPCKPVKSTTKAKQSTKATKPRARGRPARKKV